MDEPTNEVRALTIQSLPKAPPLDTWDWGTFQVQTIALSLHVALSASVGERQTINRALNLVFGDFRVG